MSAEEDFADGKFKIECSELVLTQVGSNGTVIRGPGEIWQDEKGVLQYKMFLAHDDYVSLQRHMGRPRVVGQIIPDEDYFTLAARQYTQRQWSSERVLPGCRGGLREGLACGPLCELVRSEDRFANGTSDFVSVRFREKFDFPCNQGTETVIRVGGRDHRATSTLNAAFVEDRELKFEVFYESEHTSVTLHLPSGQLTASMSNRIQEALQFILGRQLAMMVIETRCGDEHVTRLASPFGGRGKMSPPLQWQAVDEGGHVWRLFINYFRHVHANTGPGWHPISRHIGSALESAGASLSAHVLDLAIAVEGVAGECFAHLAPVSADFSRELDAIAAEIQQIEISDRTRRRVVGSIDAMRRPRNSDIVRAFIDEYNLSPGLYDSWSRLRNPAAHGRGTGGLEIETVLQLKSEGLSLLYSLVFAAVNYSGRRTDYSLAGWPLRPWPPTAPQTRKSSAIEVTALRS